MKHDSRSVSIFELRCFGPTKNKTVDDEFSDIAEVSVAGFFDISTFLLKFPTTALARTTLFVQAENRYSAIRMELLTSSRL
ncbi:unnamed protein product [Acanthoscelides obtectus]|uniref:Uncharacterized protein n=1 Tax=Acanthoscelides obtectus TaxID=200917 RepID=A0A9P0QAE2_ACAOB|nr:unnamed protein product [Acanthoscelides obtectus]